MQANPRLNFDIFKIQAVISMLLASIILTCSFYIGKNEFFLMLNADLGPVADFVFHYFTYVGDGLLWFIWLIAMLAKKRRHLLPLMITAFIATSVFVQVCKHFILPDDPRPAEAIRGSFIHFIEGTTIHSINSFPSGHTATAFTFTLLIALLTRSFTVNMIAFIAATIVGYTRIYQGQHFPLDVGAGIIVAVISVSIAAIVQQNVMVSRARKLQGSQVVADRSSQRA
jgi:membrane-associated phospholipid phosphatase